MAMHHGHRAAYYVQKFLEGVRDPLPYRTPFKTRRVPVAQDALWEVFPREDQAFHGLGANPVEFPEIESTYDAESAKREAARCYRCDAETGSSDYNVRTREDIFVMARTRPADAPKQRAVFTRRLRVSNQAHFHPEVASLDDLVFLPANLSRLVIDPYRDACRVATPLGDGLELASPFLVGGFDDAAEEVRAAVGAAVRELGLASVGRPTAGGGRAVAAARGCRRGRRRRAGGRGARRRTRTASAPRRPSAPATVSCSGLRARRPTCPRRSRSRSSASSTSCCSRPTARSPAAGPSSAAPPISPCCATPSASCAG